jgi:hypothetical protein
MMLFGQQPPPQRRAALDDVMRRVELTIDNGSRHQSTRFTAWRKGCAGKPVGEPTLYFVDTRGASGLWSPVAVIRVYYGSDGERSYRFEPPKGDPVSLPALYAAHLTFLYLIGIDPGRQAFVDLQGRRREPCREYVIQPISACLRCGRKLTAPASIETAYGPECQKLVADARQRRHTTALEVRT